MGQSLGSKQGMSPETSTVPANSTASTPVMSEWEERPLGVTQGIGFHQFKTLRIWVVSGLPVLPCHMSKEAMRLELMLRKLRGRLRKAASWPAEMPSTHLMVLGVHREESCQPPPPAEKAAHNLPGLTGPTLGRRFGEPSDQWHPVGKPWPWPA